MTGLPTADQAWPPRPHNLVIDACAEAAVWWEGDPIRLAQFYGAEQGNGIAAPPNSVRARSKRAWNAWWGRQQAATNPVRRLHMPVAADIGRVAASTLFSDPVTFMAADGDESDALQAVVDASLNTDDMYSRLLVAAESASMLSGVFGRIVWDSTVDPDHAWIDFVDADHAIPEFTWGRLTGVTFWTELDTDTDDRIVLRHLEYHGRGFIEHGLFQGTRTHIGRPIPLTEHEQTASIAVDSQARIQTGAQLLTAGYFPNHRPAPQWRSEPKLKHLGRADLTADVIRILDAIDECWSSWMRDLDLGKARMFVSESLLTSNGPGRGSAFDTDTAIFSPIGMGLREGEPTSVIEAQQFAIRVDEHARTFDALLRRAISRAGYSPITFGLADEVAATATEVDAKERDTNATRAARIRLWSGLADLATAQLQVQAHVFHTAAPGEPIKVEWPDSHQESIRQQAETLNLLNQAAAASTRTKVAMLHPDWDGKQIDEEVDRINDVAVPVSILGPGESDFGGAPADDTATADDPLDEVADGEDAKPVA